MSAAKSVRLGEEDKQQKKSLQESSGASIWSRDLNPKPGKTVSSNEKVPMKDAPPGEMGGEAGLWVDVEQDENIDWKC